MFSKRAKTAWVTTAKPKWIINLDWLIPRELPDEYEFSQEQLDDIAMLVPYAIKRARRQRMPDGRRKKKAPSRRQTAIKNLPDTTRGEKPLDIPLESTLEDRWWPKHGLWAITTSNPNSWASAAANVSNKASDDFLLLQETTTLKESTMKVCGNTARRQG